MKMWGNSTAELSLEGEPIFGSPGLMLRIVGLVMFNTFVALLLVWTQSPGVPFLPWLVGAAPFVLVYGVSIVLIRHGYPRLGAHLFIWGTLVLQCMVLLVAPMHGNQALISFANLVLSSGLMLGRRVALLACIGSFSTILLTHGVDISMWTSTAFRAQLAPWVLSSPESVLLAVASTLLTTGGLTFIGLRRLSSLLDLAVKNRAKAEVATIELERLRLGDAVRAGQAELLGVMAQKIVTLRTQNEIAQEVADTVAFAVAGGFVIVANRNGQVLSVARRSAVPREGGWPALPVTPVFTPRGPAGFLTDSELTSLSPFTGGERLQRGRIVGQENGTVLMIVAGDAARIEGDDVVWFLVAANNLLAAALHRIHLEHSLSQSQRMDALGRLSAGITHDFNNLLTSILGGVELARHHPGDAQQVGAYLDGIQLSTERAAGLTHKLTAFTSAIPQKPVALDVVSLVERMLPTLRRAVEESIEVELVLLEDEAWVDADKVDLERILVNLVVNAREALTQAGNIEIGVEIRNASGMPEGRDQPVVAFWVEDDGVGMSQALIDHVFEPFFTTRSETGSSGMGLSIVYGLVQGMGGDIFVSSDTGEGARFEICLPNRSAPTLVASTVAPQIHTPSGHRILVVEDDEDVCSTICDMLEVAGYAVAFASNGAEGLELLADDTHFSLILTDVVMPGMGGFEFCAALRQRGILIDLALVSGYAPPMAEGDESRPKLPIISKPFTLAQLVRFVSEIIG
jgi:signal transduction histidine kinase/CheY-like chemotaxis protein